MRIGGRLARVRLRRRVLLVFALVVTAVAAHAAAQGQAPVLVENVTPLEATVTENASAEVTFRLTNLNPEKSFFVSVTTDGLQSWTTAAEPNRFMLHAGVETNLTVTLTPPASPAATERGLIVVGLQDTMSGAVTKVPFNVTLNVQRDALVLGAFDNPLGPPLDNAYGVFLLDMVFWSGVGVVAYLAGDAFARYLTRYARRDVTRNVIAKIRWPLFFFVFILGVRESFGVLPRNVLTQFVDRFLTVIAVGIVGLFLLYRVLVAAIDYYQAEVAPRTRTQLDDILAPFLRKVVLVFVVLSGIGYFLRLAGVDVSVLFAGAGVMGIVIGLAAQESLSNFFGGLFILLDRPFREGDDLQLETGEVVRVEKVGLRSTKLYHYREHDMIILPNNALVTGRVTNLSYPDPRFRLQVDVGVAYGSDVEKVKRALLEATANDERIVHEPDESPFTRFNAFGDNALNFAVRFAVHDFRDRWQIANDVRERIDVIFRREGIEVPFPQRTMWMRQMPTLRVEDAREAGSSGRGSASGSRSVEVEEDGHGA